MELFTPKFIICLLFCAVAHHQLAFVEARPQFISPEEAPAQASRIAASDGEQPPEKAEQAAQPVDQDQQQEEPNGKPTSAGETKIEGPKEVQDQTPLKAPVSEGETQPPSNDEGQVKEPAAETTAAEKSPPAEAAPPMVVNDGEPPGVSRAYVTGFILDATML